MISRLLSLAMGRRTMSFTEHQRSWEGELEFCLKCAECQVPLIYTNRGLKAEIKSYLSFASQDSSLRTICLVQDSESQQFGLSCTGQLLWSQLGFLLYLLFCTCQLRGFTPAGWLATCVIPQQPNPGLFAWWLGAALKKQAETDKESGSPGPELEHHCFCHIQWVKTSEKPAKIASLG